MIPHFKGLSTASKKGHLRERHKFIVFIISQYGKKDNSPFILGNVIVLHNKKDFPDFVSEKSFLKFGIFILRHNLIGMLLVALSPIPPERQHKQEKAENLCYAGTIHQVILYKVSQGNRKYCKLQISIHKLMDLIPVPGNTESGGGFHIFAVGQLDLNPVIPVGIQYKIIQRKALNLGSPYVLTHTFTPFQICNNVIVKKYHISIIIRPILFFK